MEITQEYLKEIFDYDFLTGNLIWKRRDKYSGYRTGWNTRYAGKQAGSFDKDGYLQVRIDNKMYKAHRLVWLLYYGILPEHDLDHINRLKNDNRIENLRLATFENLNDHEANQQNTKISKRNTSGHIGVYWYKRTKKWRARITIKQKSISLGMFDRFEDACAAYDCGKTKYHKFHPVPCQAKKIETFA